MSKDEKSKILLLWIYEFIHGEVQSAGKILYIEKSN